MNSRNTLKLTRLALLAHSACAVWAGLVLTARAAYAQRAGAAKPAKP